VGGDSDAREAGIKISFPSTRFGLNQGCLAVTAKDNLNRNIPPDLILGKVWISPPKEGCIKGDVSLLPPYSAKLLERVAVMIPHTRFKKKARYIIPDSKLSKVETGVRYIGESKRAPGGFIVFAGLERGLSRGDLLVVGGRSLARIDSVGFFSSHASLLLTPGYKFRAAAIPSETMINRFTMEVIEGMSPKVVIKSDSPVPNIRKGVPIYLTEFPCSGLESYPVAFVEDHGKNQTVVVNLSPGVTEEGIFCLKSSSVR